MKHVNYSFSDSDISACVFALTQLDLVHKNNRVSSSQIATNEHCALSAEAKLLSKKALDANELRVLCCCITYCDLICKGIVSADTEIRNKCMQYLFSLNKLKNELCSQIY